MDLGSLELQIFVSLTVVLGAAFVALVCDYLKGNNEQLREHNIELRVRREEQERRALLDPVGFAAQYAAPAPAPAAAGMARTPVQADAVMKSHASPEDLRQASDRADALSARTTPVEDPDIPEVAPPRRNRNRHRPEQPAAANNYADWVRPEVIARVARQVEPAEQSEEPAAPLPAPQPVQAAAEPEPPAAEKLPPSEAIALQKEIERVAKLERPAPQPASGLIVRPLTIPTLRLDEELERLAEPEAQPLAVVGPIHSALLEEVIAASVTKPGEDVALHPSPTLIQIAAKTEPEPVPVLADIPAAVDEPEFVDIPLPAPAAEEYEEAIFVDLPPPVEPVAEPEPELQPLPMPGLVPQLEIHPAPSALAGMGVAPPAELLREEVTPEFPASNIPLSIEETPVEEPAAMLEETEFESSELLPAFADLPAPEAEAPLEVLSFADEPAPEPPPVWTPVEIAEPAAVIEITPIRAAEPAPAALELPAGMHDNSAWTQLLSLPQPMTGILFTIALSKAESAPVAEAGKKPAVEVPDLTEAMDRLMNSFVKDQDFGAHIGENEWVFVYKFDATGFNQRRVAGISEKLWDFQLRHLGMSSVAFKWGAVEVEAEKLEDALAAARDRMNQSPKRARKLPGADTPQPRRVVNA